MMGMTKIKITINTKTYERQVEPNILLSEFIRENIGLTGTHVGCDTSQCGACVINLNGEIVKSCSILAVQANECTITTVEGLKKEDKNLHPMQTAFQENHGLQCGFCTPGILLTAIDLVNRNPNPQESDIRNYLDGNLCRCTGYQNIVLSIIEGAKAMRK